MASRAVQYLCSNVKSLVAEKSLILFDGVCNLCNGFVQYIILRDRKNYFMFGSLQSVTAQEKLRAFQDAPGDLSTVVLIEDEQLFTSSTAVLRIALQLGGIWKLTYPLIFLPKFVRDGVYRFISRYRYRVFGKRNDCMIPRPEWKSRFVN